MEVSALSTISPSVSASPLDRTVTDGTFRERLSNATSTQSAPVTPGLNLQALLHSSAVSEVLSFDQTGAMHWKDPGRVITSQESIAWNAYSSANPSAIPENTTWYHYQMTDDDKAYIRQVTGYNVVTFDDGAQMIVDDQGNWGLGPQAEAAFNLAFSIECDRSYGSLQGPLTPEYVSTLFDNFEKGKYPAPASVIEKSRQWFDTLMKMVSPKQTPDETPGNQIKSATNAYSRADQNANETDIASHAATQTIPPLARPDLTGSEPRSKITF